MATLLMLLLENDQTAQPLNPEEAIYLAELFSQVSVGGLNHKLLPSSSCLNPVTAKNLLFREFQLEY